MKFAFYGRVSTEDQQDPTSSKGWQLARAKQLVEPYGGVIVREFFDLGTSRALPWKRRPEASALLESFRDPSRGFGGVVIGEPARAFYGQQFGLTFPVFVHFDVELWVPEVGGRVDPGSEAHELVMSMYGGMSKGERNRIKIRVRTAMADQASREGRFLGGRPPFGYRLVDAGPHPNPSKAADGKRLHRLGRDPVTAPIVARIFREYSGGRGYSAIASGLTIDGVPSPSAYDPGRNPHRLKGPWAKSAVRAILMNPRYLGKQVWARQRRDEQLIDVDDVAAGHETKMRWNNPDDWVWSNEKTHEELVDEDTYDRVQSIRNLGKRREKTAQARNPYILIGLVTCALCGRKMGAQTNRGRAVYRCRLLEEYAVVRELDHPKSVAVGESPIVEALDGWLMRLFGPEDLDDTVGRLAAAQNLDEAAEARIVAARRQLSACDRKLAKFRKALEADADPVLVATWIADVQAEQIAAERVLAAAESPASLTVDELRELIGRMDIRAALNEADAASKKRLYEALGVRLTFDAGRRIVRAEVDPAGRGKVRVGGGT